MFAHKTIQFYTFPIPCRIAEVIFSSLLGSLLFISIVLFLIFLASLGRLQQISKQFCREKLSTTVLQIIEKIESQNSDCWMQDYHQPRPCLAWGCSTFQPNIKILVINKNKNFLKLLWKLISLFSKDVPSKNEKT